MSDQHKKDITPDPDTLEDALQDAVDAADKRQVADIVESITSQEALRQACLMNADERDQLISILSPDAAAELIEDAPAGLAGSIIEGLDSAVAAKIMEELQSDTQADIVNEIKKKNADAILSAMDFESAEDVRKLSSYDPDTAVGLMELETFTFRGDDTGGGDRYRHISSHGFRHERLLG